MCSCQRTTPIRLRQEMQPRAIRFRQNPFEFQMLKFDLQVVGVTGFEPVTPRLSSACSNQLSYTPWRAKPAFQIPNLKFEIQKAGGAEETRTPDL